MVLSSGLWAIEIIDQWGWALQPDGTELEIHHYGDKKFVNGYVVVYGNGGWYYYAELDAQGEYEASPYKVGIDDPASNGIPKYLQRSAARQAAIDSVRIAHGYARDPNSRVQGMAGDPSHFVCTKDNKCKGYVVLVSFPEETDPGEEFYNDYDQPYGYSWDLFNQFFNGGYETGVAAYKGTTALPRRAMGQDERDADTEAVFGSVRAYFDEVYGEDIIEFELLNKKNSATK